MQQEGWESRNGARRSGASPLHLLALNRPNFASDTHKRADNNYRIRPKGCDSSGGERSTKSGPTARQNELDILLFCRIHRWDPGGRTCGREDLASARARLNLALRSMHWVSRVGGQDIREARLRCGDSARYRRFIPSLGASVLPGFDAAAAEPALHRNFSSRPTTAHREPGRARDKGIRSNQNDSVRESANNTAGRLHPIWGIRTPTRLTCRRTGSR